MDSIDKTAKTYEYLWLKNKNVAPVYKWHFDSMQDAIVKPIVTGLMGIDAGSGCGYDTYIMAKNNPPVKIISLDISDGVYKTKELTKELSNVWVVKGSVLNMPFKDNVFDFAYSFGVLHHTPAPKRGLKEIGRVIKKEKAAYLYLYEDHSENMIKYFILKIVAVLRYITIMIPKKILHIFSFLASPFVVVFFAYPSKIFRRFRLTKRLGEEMPFNFGTHLFSLTGDLYDRFGAPIEFRFSRKQAQNLFSENGFHDVNITRLKNTAGWAIWGYKN